MMPVELSCVGLGDDAISELSCLPKSVSLWLNEITCLGQLNGSHMNSIRECGDTRGGRLRSKALTVDAPDEWTATMILHDLATVSPMSG